MATEYTEDEVLTALREGFKWVGEMPAEALQQDNINLVSPRKTAAVLQKLHKRGLITRSKTRHNGVFLWGLPGEWVKLDNHPRYFTHEDEMT